MQINRCRFIDWIPIGITTMTYSPDNNWLLVVRQNSDLEIWNIHSKFYCEYVYYF